MERRLSEGLFAFGDRIQRIGIQAEPSAAVTTERLNSQVAGLARSELVGGNGKIKEAE